MHPDELKLVISALTIITIPTINRQPESAFINYFLPFINVSQSISKQKQKNHSNNQVDASVSSFLNKYFSRVYIPLA